MSRIGGRQTRKYIVRLVRLVRLPSAKKEQKEDVYNLLHFFQSVRNGFAFGAGSSLAYQLITRTLGQPVNVNTTMTDNLSSFNPINTYCTVCGYTTTHSTQHTAHSTQLSSTL